MSNDVTVINTFSSFADMRVKKHRANRYNSKSVIEYSIDGEVLNCYESISDASKSTGKSYSTIIDSCLGRTLYSRIKDAKLPDRIFLYRGADIAERLEAIEKNKKKPQISNGGKTVYEYTIGGRLTYQYPSLADAAKANGVCTSTIVRCCEGATLFVKDRIFLFSNTNLKERVRLAKAALYRLSHKKPKLRPVDAYTLDGAFIKAFPSASAACKELGCCVSAITRCCYGGDKYDKNRLTSKGKIFLWAGESISDRLELIKQLKNKKQ